MIHSTAKIAKNITVDLGERSYDILIGTQLLENAGFLLEEILRRPRTFIVTDENIAKYQLKRLLEGFEKFKIETEVTTLPAGENTKSYAHLEQLTGLLLEQGVERSDVVIAFGGGVIGDLTGFAAAILRRGVDFVQIPTTLLAQVDSSVGGKVAINTSHGKNLIGAFHQPLRVLCDMDVLNTLPKRELMAGFAELVKYGLLGDETFFGWLETNSEALINGDVALREEGINVSCANKAKIVAADEREEGQRALLNLGHTFGHALEAETGYSDTLLHGEGVAIGMMLAFEFSQSLGICPGQDVERVRAFFEKVGLPHSIKGLTSGEMPLKFSPEALLHHMHQDKKVSGGELTFILVKGIGKSFVVKGVPAIAVLEFLEKAV